VIHSIASQFSLANTALVRQSITEADRLSYIRSHSWFQTAMMTNPITAPMALVSELFSGMKRI
jgi:hypothetical protein